MPEIDERPFESVRDLMASLVQYLPTLLAGLVVLLIGVIVGWLVGRVLVRLLVFLRVDKVVARLGWAQAVERGDVRHSLFDFIGTLVAVLVFLIFLENALVIWHLTVLSQLLEKFVLLVPQFLSAVIILLIGWGVATAVSRGVQRALYQEEFERSRLAARLVRWAILCTTTAITLVHLDVAVGIVTGGFLITFGALALSAVLAFGLGSRRAVELMWEERFRKRRELADEADKAENKK